MRAYSHLAVPAILSVLLTGCATVSNIELASDPAHDFSGYTKFSWASETPMIANGDLSVSKAAEVRISDAIKSEFSRKGYLFVPDRKDADFAISYVVGTRHNVSIDSYPKFAVKNREKWKWGREYFDPRMANFPKIRVTRKKQPTVTVARISTEGALSIDVFEIENSSPIWHVRAHKLLSDDEIQGKTNGIDQAVGKILANFPPAL